MPPGTIDQLHFEVILGHSQFDKEIKAVEKAANKLNTSVSDILTKIGKIGSKQIITKQGVKNAADMVVYLEQIRQKIASMPKGSFLVGDADQLNKTLQQILPKLDQIVNKSKSAKGGFDGMNTSLSTTNGLMRTLTQLTGAAFSVVGIRRFLSSLIDITGQFEVQRMALRNMLQDVDAADKIFEDLYRFSSDSTYRFSELAKYAKQLAAFNIDKSNLLETTKMLGDVASGVGVSMDRIILAYGHVKSSGFLRGIQLRSFAQNGVPVLEELAKMFTEIEGKVVSLGDVFDKMTRRQIPFEMVEEAFRRMTGEGGKFYQMQEVLAKTLAGQINILKGRWENLLAAMGQANDGILKDTVKSLSNIVSSTENFGRALKTVVLAVGVYEGAMITAGVVTGNMSIAMTALVKVVARLWTALAKNPWAILAAGVALVAANIYKTRMEVDELEKVTKTAQKSIDNYYNALGREIGELDTLYEKLRYAKEGTEEYNKAKLALESRFGPYIQEIRAESGEVKDLADMYDALAEKIRDANKARAKEAATHDIAKTYGETLDKIESSFNVLVHRMETMMGRELTAIEREGLWQRMTGGLNESNIGRWERVRPDLEKGLNAGFGAESLFKLGEVNDIKDFYKEIGRRYKAGSETVQDVFEVLGEAWKKATDNYVAANARIDEAFRVFNSGGSGGGNATPLSGWRKLVADAIAGFDTKTLQKTGLAAKDDEDYYEYLERVGKKFKELREEQDKALKVDKPMYKTWINSIKAVDKALEGNILSDARYNKEPWNGSGSKDPNKEAITDLRARISLWEKYLSIYRQLEPLYGKEGATKMMAERLGGSAEEYSNIEGEIEKLCDSLRELGKDGKMAAYQVEAALGLGWAKDLNKDAKDSAKALRDYETAEAKIAEYLSKNFGTEGEKTAAKISKLLADLATANAKADNTVKNLTDTLDKEKEAVVKKYLETIKDNGLSEEEQKKLADAYWEEYRTNRIKEIKAQAQQEKDYNNRNTREAIRGQAKALFNQQMFGYDLSHWGDKTLSQILEIEDALKNLEIPQDVRDELEGNKDALEALKKELKALAESALQKTVTPEKWKKVAEMTKDVSSNVASLSDSLEGLGDAMNDSGIKGFASALKTASSYANTISDAFTGLMQASANGAEWGGVWGFIIAFGTQFLSTIIDLTAKSQQEAAALRDRYKEVGDAIKEAYHESQIENFADALERAGDSLFGDNALARVARATRELQSLREQIAAMSSIAGFTTISQNGVNYGSISLEAAARQSGMALYDENNNYNAKLLNWIKDQGWDLTEEELDWLNRQIELSTNYAKALEPIEDALSSLVNNVASDAADKLVDQWIEAGNAALDYADILDDVAKSYAKMLIQSTIMENFLDPITDDLKAAFIGGRYEDAMSILAGAMQEIQNSAPVFENILKAFDPYFKAAEGSDDSSSVGKGIKSITEETASLLASYLNAIRADVSYMRSMAESGWLNVENIARAITPNLADYVQQIAANTYNTAETTAAILSELQSVIGAPGATSPMVLRVEMA